MARVTFKKGERKELHGTFCGLVYKQRNGQQHVYKLPLPVLPKKPTVEQQKKYIKDCIVQGCVSEIQHRLYEQGESSVARMQEIADRYAAIKKAAERMYDDFKPYFKGKAINKLDEAIVYWFCYKRLTPELAFDYAVTQMPQGGIKVTRVSALAPHTKRYASFFGDPALPTTTLTGCVGDPKNGDNLPQEYTEGEPSV